MKKIFLLLYLFPLVLMAQEERNTRENAFRTDTLVSDKSIKFIGIPIAFYTPETEFAFGGGGQIFLLKNTNTYNERLSNILFSGIYTLNEQLIFEVKPQIYLGKGNYFIDASYQLEIYPNQFWGIGPKTLDTNLEIYKQTTHALRFAFLKRLPPDLNFGFEYTFKNHQVTEIQEGGILASGTVPGSDRAVVSALGAIFNLDTRDNTGSPTKGQYLQAKAQFSSELIGATSAFNKYVIDLRTYSVVNDKSTLATQIYAESNYGDIPFQALASYGGGTRARGYFFGRFIDNHMYVVQAEYRYRFKPRWTAAAFGLIGEVAERPETFFNADTFKPSFGAGVRYKLFKDQNTYLRFDIGSGIDGNSGIYFGVNEAF
ncbi:BamA/TamA family outer membrane protein [uncultured Dokdonia sp.]|uniref:BamA/TamA family outer membrane protein n=1 Tax=uncultured Dokdonia sp. TaxID=575653 RepID=UPI00260CDEB4|nr:BamA/TamA family outer membrane protein [uncultured Dokdonia sp.]